MAEHVGAQLIPGGKGSGVETVPLPAGVTAVDNVYSDTNVAPTWVFAFIVSVQGFVAQADPVQAENA